MREDTFDSRDLAGVHPHCVDQARKRVPFFRDLSDIALRSKIEQAVRCADQLDLIYDNPKRRDQYLAYAQFHGHDFWFVVGPNETRKPGGWLIVTLFVHKDKHEYKEYLSDVERHLGRDVGAVA